ncbi:hypothetical protein KFU94_63485 [Chloroflexi bacterium TSY]|nr:hypothetical protein [Chloroflexi bacterium TSY]
MNQLRTQPQDFVTVIVEAWRNQTSIAQPHSAASQATKMLATFATAALTLPKANFFGITPGEYAARQAANQSATMVRQPFVLPKGHVVTCNSLRRCGLKYD